MSKVAIFFSVFGREKDRFSFILPKVNNQFVIYKPVAYIGEVLRPLCWNNNLRLCLFNKTTPLYTGVALEKQGKV